MKSIIFFINFIAAIFAKSKTNDDRNINVALETVLEFDGKEADGDKQFLNNMQTFLEKIKNTIGFQRAKPKGSQNSMNTDDFVKHLFSALSGLDKKEMDIISKTIEAEIKRRFDDDEDFRELVQIPVVRRSLSSGLQTLRKSPKKLWSSFARSLQPSSETSEKDETSMRSTIQNWSNNFMSWVNNMFHKDDPPMKQNLYKVIDDINDYSKTKGLEQRILQPHQKDPYSSEDEQQAKQQKVKEIDEVLRNPEKLVSIVKNALRTLLFDQYSNLDSKKRKLIQLRLQSFWMDPDEKDGKEKHNADKREQKKKHKDSSKEAPRPPKRNRDKHHDKKKGLKSRFVIQHTTTKRSRHHKPRFEDEMKKGKSHGYQNILRMKKEKEEGKSSLTDTKEDGFKFPDDRSDPSPGSAQKSDYFEPIKKSGEKSSELNDHSSSSEHQPITSGTTLKSPRTERPPKKSMGILQDSEYSHSSDSNPHNSGYNSRSKESLRDRTHKKYTTSQKPNDLIKTTTTKPTIPTRTESSVSFESQSRESTTEKSLMDSLREIIQDEPKPYFNLDKEKDSSKQNQEKSQESSEFFDSSKSKEKSPQSKSKDKAKAIRSGKNRVEKKSKSGSVSKSESKSVEHKSKSEKHSNENTKNKEIKKVEEETLESWSEFDSKDENKHKANTQKSDEVKGSEDSKTHKEENKIDSSSEWLEKPVVKAKSNEKPQPKQSRISNEKKRISHPGKETTSATKPREAVSPQVRIIETETAVINVVKEDEVFTDHSAEKNRGKNKTNEQDKKGKVKPAVLSKKQDRVNRALSEELRTKLPNITYVENDTDDLYDEPSAKKQSKSLTTKKDTYILAYDDHRTTTTHTATTTQRSTTTKKDTYIVNSNLAPYNIEVGRVIKDIMNQRDSQELQKAEKHKEVRKEPKISFVQGDSTSWINNTVQQDNLDMNASLSPMLSAESQALYKALEEQERKHGLDNLLDNADLIDLQKLNISFINQNSLEGNDNRKYTLALKNKLK